MLLSQKFVVLSRFFVASRMFGALCRKFAVVKEKVFALSRKVVFRFVLNIFAAPVFFFIFVLKKIFFLSRNHFVISKIFLYRFFFAALSRKSVCALKKFAAL